MARRRIGQERLGLDGASARGRSSLDEVAALVDWSELDRLLADISSAARGELGWPPLALFRAMLLAITAIVSSVVLVAIGVELAQPAAPKAADIALIIGTLLIAWLFSNMVYALHYAHIFYSAGSGGEDRGGMEFPGEDEPDYWDFTYFAFTLGMTFQTSDVTILSRGVRRIALFHCFAAFVFNIGVLAFTINVLGS